jgi:hypothetical protein
MFINRGLHSFHKGAKPPDIVRTIPYAADFNGTTAYLDLATLVSSDDATNHTFSFWMRTDAIDAQYGLFQGWKDSNNLSYIAPRDDGDFRVTRLTTGSVTLRHQATDHPADTNWHHYVVHYNSNEAAAANRFKMWVDGSAAATTINDSIALAQGLAMFLLANAWMRIGASSTPVYLDARLAEVVVLDGIIEPYTSFGETSEASWVPKIYDGASGYGTAGFHLNFADDTDLGKDVSGNANHFTNSNVTQSTDIPEDPA